ncbi:putative histone-lysine N-methyltransferase PRDM6 [Exaiptasia diaphana]|nr:putative histone-lysine N-methyltransferase PRDM6 [Exaiptasia diaphana]
MATTTSTDQEHIEKRPSSQGSRDPKYNFTTSEILAYLFSRSELKSVSITKESSTNRVIRDCVSCDDLPNGSLCSHHQHLETLRLLRSPDNRQLSRAMSSFPPEVELCTSSVPGKGYGVRAVRTIPEGTWIGPYEGKQVKPQEITPHTDTSYMWEIFQEGSLAHYLDGSDEQNSSWMRFIRCARYKGEQNTSVMQYFGNIYYRVFQEISPGNEILVWYDDTCPHYLGIPLKMQDIGTSSRESKDSRPFQVQSRIPVKSPTITNPNVQVASVSRPMMAAFAPHHPFPPIVRQPPQLPRYQVTYPMVPRDTLMHSSFPNSLNYNIRELNDAYSAVSLYGNQSPYMVNGKSRSPSSLMVQKNVNNALNSHGIIPYSRDHQINQSRTNMTMIKRSAEITPSQLTSSSVSRDVKCSESGLDQNANFKESICYSEKLKVKQAGMTSSDNTITKLLSQIEEARVEEMKAKQQALRDKEANSSPDDGLEMSIWKCGQCDKSFAQQQILQLHICPSVPEKPYKCTYCPDAFAQPSDLRTHAVCHNGKKPFKCGYCSRLFAGSTTLNNHIRTHTGERPFGCEKCGKEFSQASQLSRHRRALFECN